MSDSRMTNQGRSFGPLVALGVLLLLLGLPIAAWLDMRGPSERILRRQADEISRIIDDMRGFYASDVVGRVLAQHAAVPTHNYKEVSGGIPIPATLSIELGQRISARNDAVRYRFVSDLPLAGRPPHNLDVFEQDAVAALRKDPPRSASGASAREVVPYAFEGLVDELKQRPNVISEHATGVDLFLDLEVMDKSAVERTRRLLQQALAAIEMKAKPGAS